jgi:hypothetical protein
MSAATTAATPAVTAFELTRIPNSSPSLFRRAFDVSGDPAPPRIRRAATIDGAARR